MSNEARVRRLIKVIGGHKASLTSKIKSYKAMIQLAKATKSSHDISKLWKEVDRLDETMAKIEENFTELAIFDADDQSMTHEASLKVEHDRSDVIKSAVFEAVQDINAVPAAAINQQPPSSTRARPNQALKPDPLDRDDKPAAFRNWIKREHSNLRFQRRGYVLHKNPAERFPAEVSSYPKTSRVLSTVPTTGTIFHRLLFKLKEQELKKKFLGQEALTLETLDREAHSYEAAKSSLSALSGSSVRTTSSKSSWNRTPVHKLSCDGCRGDHRRIECPYTDAKCYICKRKGHISKVCRSKKSYRTKDKSRPHSRTDSRTRAASPTQEEAYTKTVFASAVQAFQETNDRVAQIHRGSSPSQWHRLRPSLNHAEDIARGLEIKDIVEGRWLQWTIFSLEERKGVAKAREFTSRRGPVKLLRRDRLHEHVGTEKELEELLEKLLDESLEKKPLERGIEWNFNQPTASPFRWYMGTTNRVQ
ncbi:hypothetical protein GQR58_005758 [Nymphon striatum]|nr:hypothetical protein GQR58_005758 [Nymphon striatum]